MRKSAGVGAAVAFACAACTYDVPDLASGGDDGAAALQDAGQERLDGSLLADSHVMGHPGMPDAADTGDPDGSSTNDAACTGILCPCNNATDCSSGICAQAITVGQPVYTAATGNFCTAPCCTSSDCPAGSVCFASGVGGQYCVSPAWLARSAPSATAMGGAACSTGADCRSGLCVTSTCADTCCSFTSSTAECTGSAVCAFGTFPGATNADMHFAPRCEPPPGTTPYAQPCGSNSDCQGGLCAGQYCTNPCRSPGECGSGNTCDYDPQASDVYWACYSESVGTNLEGAACGGMDTQCLSDWCGPTNQCENECFTKADCTVAGWNCTPEPNGSYVFLICQP